MVPTEGKLVELAKITEHSDSIGNQVRPEFLSQPIRPHPLFIGLIKKAKERNKK